MVQHANSVSPRPPSARRHCLVAIVSDIHYACEEEQARRGYESRAISNPFVRTLIAFFRRFIWLKDPLAHNALLDHFLDAASPHDPNLVVANGDYSCDTRFIGLCEKASYKSAEECLGKLRERFGDRLLVNLGDHELGKTSVAGGQGGPRLASYHAVCDGLGLHPFWTRSVGDYLLVGVASTLVSWPIFAAEALPEERNSWLALQQQHANTISACFQALSPSQRVILFCHDPTALPFLLELDPVKSRLAQVEMTIIGHLHTPLVLWKSRLLAGMPPIRCLGSSIHRMSTALNRAGLWKQFKVRLCPSLAGCELLKDGGFGLLHLDPDASLPARLHIIPVPRHPPG